MELLGHGANVHKQDRDGMKMLHLFARDGTEKEISHLLGMGGTLTAHVSSGQTLLHIAAWHWNAPAVRAMLAKGADREAVIAMDVRPFI